MNQPGLAEVLAWTQAVSALRNQVGTPVAPASSADGITLDQLRVIMPNLPADKAKEYLPLLNSAMSEWEINTPLRQAAFLAQIGHESTDLTEMTEKGEGWRNYEGSRVLGNTERGDGERFKGRGPIQLTGRDNYTRAGAALDLDLVNTPEKAADPVHGFRIAGWFWDSKKLNPLADQGEIREVSEKINGGKHGMSDRLRRYDEAKRVLGI